MTKMTKKVALRVALEALSLVSEQMTPNTDWTIDEVRAKLTEMMEALDRKSTSSKPSKTQQENEGVKEAMLSLLAANEPMRASEIAKALDLSSGQKAAALLNALAKEGKIVKVKGEKGAVLFTLPDPEAEAEADGE